MTRGELLPPRRYRVAGDGFGGRPLLNGVEISRASNDDVYDLVIDVAAGQPTVDTNAKKLRQLAT